MRLSRSMPSIICCLEFSALFVTLDHDLSGCRFACMPVMISSALEFSGGPQVFIFPVSFPLSSMLPLGWLGNLERPVWAPSLFCCCYLGLCGGGCIVQRPHIHANGNANFVCPFQDLLALRL